jgi:monoamine oxidase
VTTRRNFLTQVGRAGGFGAAYLIMQSLGLLPIAASEASRLQLPAGSG